jgi:single-strand DNA-binding protein
MAGFSKVFLFGNLTRDPEQRVTTTGLTITKFSVAISRKFKGQDGSQKEEVTFVDVDSFGRQAELIGQSFRKGSPIMVEGRLRLDQWESNTGEKRSKLTVALENFYYTSSRSDSEHGGSEGGHSFEGNPYDTHTNKSFSSRPTPTPTFNASNKAKRPTSIESIEEDDVPF